MTVVDCHTHSLRHDAIVCRQPDEPAAEGYLYAVGCHPWNASDFNESQLEKEASLNSTVAIGETGLDALRGLSPEVQEAAFRRHIELSERLGKPLIVHCVRAFDRLLAIKKEMRPRQPWIIHGFSRKPELARQLLNAGCYLSLGPRFNPATAAIIPADRLLIETDDDPAATIDSVAHSVGQARHTTDKEILTLTSTTLQNLILSSAEGRM